MIPLAALSAVACAAAPEGSDGSAETASASALTPIINPGPIHLHLYPGPTPSESALNFGNVNPGGSYQQTVWFPITQDDNFSAKLGNTYGGTVEITNIQAWWNAWGCYAGSPNADCFDMSIGGAGTLSGVQPAEIVGVTVTVKPSFSDPSGINTTLIVSGTNDDWVEQLNVTGAPLTCAAAMRGLDIKNALLRYNDIAIDVTSPSPVAWGWKVTSGNLQSWGTLPAGGGYADVGAQFFGPPYTIWPNTWYTVTVWPGGIGSACAPVNLAFLTPPDPESQCEIDHDCGDANGDEGGGAVGGGYVSCGGGDDCCAGGDCDPG